jgi:hypothetical protein
MKGVQTPGEIDLEGFEDQLESNRFISGPAS